MAKLINKNTKVVKTKLIQFSSLYKLKSYINDGKANVGENEIDVSKIDISNLDTLSGLFEELNVEKIIGLEHWDVSHIRDFSYMFSRCKYLVEISDISKWNYTSAEDLSFMFYGTWMLETDINIKIPKTAKTDFIKRNSKHPIGIVKY